MLRRLSVRDIILIDRLDLDFDRGLATLTGETGAGKSILLDSLGLALGARGDTGLVRPTAKQATVTALFDMPNSEVAAVLADAGIDHEDGEVLIRRQVSPDGRSRAFVNDQPVTVGLLREIGERLVEIHGQYERYGMLNPAAHGTVLDAYGQLGETVATVRTAYETWQAAVAAEVAAAEELVRTRAIREQIGQTVEDLDALAPEAGEEANLVERRELLQQAERLGDALQSVNTHLAGDSGASSALHRALRDLSALSGAAAERASPAVAAIESATVEVEEALHTLQVVVADVEADPNELERVEERLFALRAQARRSNCSVDDLPAMYEGMRKRLEALKNEGEHLTTLAQASEDYRRTYVETAEVLSKRRKEAAKRLEAAVAKELPPLHLGQASLRVQIDRLQEADWGKRGFDRVVFAAKTNPGMPVGPLHKIASGGELSRFLLAVKVVLAGIVGTPTIVFDEIDAGVGGATAAAIGERLAQLAADRQVLAVTHSPQVAARAQRHLLVKKRTKQKTTITEVDVLPTVARREEIARMLAGSRITDEARAAADQLMALRPV